MYMHARTYAPKNSIYGMLRVHIYIDAYARSRRGDSTCDARAAAEFLFSLLV